MKITRGLINLLVKDTEVSKAFYTKFFDFEVVFDSDWFVDLKSTRNSFEIGLISAGHPTVPKELALTSGGCYTTLVIEDVDEFYALAKANNVKIIEEPCDMFYGQRRCVIEDPDGNSIDVSSLIR